MRRLAVLLILLATGCGSTPPRSGDALPQFSLHILPGSYLGGGSAAAFDYAANDDNSRLVVTVTVHGARGLKACDFELGYDAAQLTPVSAQADAALRGAGQLVELHVLSQPGTVSCGAVLAHWDTHAGFSGDGAVASVVFERRPFVSLPATHAVSDAELNAFTKDNSNRTDVSYDPATGMASWRYLEPGDLDQNGEIGLSDLAPLARFFGQDASHSDPNSVLWLCDADHNGEVNLADLAVIAAHFGRQITAVNIYAATEYSDGYPSFRETQSSIAKWATSVPLSSASGNKANERLKFTFYWLHSGEWLWVQNSGPAGLGQVSQQVYVGKQPAGYTFYDPQGYQLRWDGSALHWYANVWGDFDQNGEVNISDLQGFGKYRNSAASSDPSLQTWAIDRNHDGVVDVEDLRTLEANLYLYVDRYAVFASDADPGLYPGWYSTDLREPIAILYWNDNEGTAPGSGFDRGRLSFAYTPATDMSGKYMWVRPMANDAGRYGTYGTRSGVVQIP